MDFLCILVLNLSYINFQPKVNLNPYSAISSILRLFCSLICPLMPLAISYAEIFLH